LVEKVGAVLSSDTVGLGKGRVARPIGSDDVCSHSCPPRE